MKILIMAAGGSERWNNYLGVPKHLAPIYGEPLIHRTKRQFGRDSVVVSTNSRYDQLAVAPQPTENTPLPHTGLGHSYVFWSKTDPTLVVLGDVVFSKQAANKLKEWFSDEITFFGRSSQTTSGHCRELFAIYIPVRQHQRMLDAMTWVKANRDKMGQPHGGGWLVYAKLNRVNLGVDPIEKNFVQIQDGFTDDFDYPHQYEQWVSEHPKEP